MGFYIPFVWGFVGTLYLVSLPQLRFPSQWRRKPSCGEGLQDPRWVHEFRGGGAIEVTNLDYGEIPSISWDMGHYNYELHPLSEAWVAVGTALDVSARRKSKHCRSIH